jgi:hypothetical protein
MLLGGPDGTIVGPADTLAAMRWAVAVGILAVLAGSSGAARGAPAAGCPALSGSFSAIRGSAGAGNIVYLLRVRNGGTKACVLKGTPSLRLLGLGGKLLPTHVVADTRFKALPIVVRPGKSATAKARFSPDVPGKGEASTKRCEPIAHTARVVAAGSSFVVPVRPPTSVCEHGTMTFTPYR